MKKAEAKVFAETPESANGELTESQSRNGNGGSAVPSWFVRTYRPELAEAERADPLSYPSFNDFFTRELKPGSRVFDARPEVFASPSDAIVGATGASTVVTLFCVAVVRPPAKLPPFMQCGTSTDKIRPKVTVPLMAHRDHPVNDYQTALGDNLGVAPIPEQMKEWQMPGGRAGLFQGRGTSLSSGSVAQFATNTQQTMTKKPSVTRISGKVRIVSNGFSTALAKATSPWGRTGTCRSQSLLPNRNDSGSDGTQ